MYLRLFRFLSKMGLYVLLISFILLLFEPIFFKVYAEVMYDRKVDFKTINADIAIMGKYVEYQDLQFMKKVKSAKDFLSRTDGMGIEQALNVINDNTINGYYNRYLTDPSNVNVLKKVSQRYKVKIEKDKFKQLGFAKKSVETYIELLSFQNEMMDNPHIMFIMKPDKVKYPNLFEFWQHTIRFSNINKIDDLTIDDSSIIRNPFSVYAIVGDPISENAARLDCGYYGNFKPAYKLPYKITGGFSSYTAGKNKLTSWGYHLTANYAAATYTDHTRDQNYHPWLCGINNFRDHANITDKNRKAVRTSNSRPYSINEQNYSGRVPRGEPNPEILNKIWPYADWAAYVVLYHSIY